MYEWVDSSKYERSCGEHLLGLIMETRKGVQKDYIKMSTWLNGYES